MFFEDSRQSSFRELDGRHYQHERPNVPIKENHAPSQRKAIKMMIWLPTDPRNEKTLALLAHQKQLLTIAKLFEKERVDSILAAGRRLSHQFQA